MTACLLSSLHSRHECSPSPEAALTGSLLQLPCLWYLDGEDAHLPGRHHVAVAVVHKDGGVCGGPALLQRNLKGLHQQLCFFVWVVASSCTALAPCCLPKATHGAWPAWQRIGGRGLPGSKRSSRAGSSLWGG